MSPTTTKDDSEIIGYFSYTSEEVFCDGDACIVASSEALMQSYLYVFSDGDGGDIIKKIRFGEVMRWIQQGGAYAFDEESYNKFIDIAEANGFVGLPSKEIFLEYPDEEMNLVRIQFFRV